MPAASLFDLHLYHVLLCWMRVTVCNIFDLVAMARSQIFKKCPWMLKVLLTPPDMVYRRHIGEEEKGMLIHDLPYMLKALFDVRRCGRIDSCN